VFQHHWYSRPEALRDYSNASAASSSSVCSCHVRQAACLHMTSSSQCSHGGVHSQLQHIHTAQKPLSTDMAFT
jgi:bisphosphoglycerate-independent phosphoglycerate mutase (AlkP superfamily)